MERRIENEYFVACLKLALFTATVKQLGWQNGNFNFFSYVLLNTFLGDTVFIQGAAATPIPLVEAMTAVGKESSLKDIKVCHMHTEGPAPYTDKDCQGKQLYQQIPFFLGS
jgi:hypothetical protein